MKKKENSFQGIDLVVISMEIRNKAQAKRRNQTAMSKTIAMKNPYILTHFQIFHLFLFLLSFFSLKDRPRLISLSLSQIKHFYQRDRKLLAFLIFIL